MDSKPLATRSDPEARKAYSRWHYRQNKAVYKARARAKKIEVRATVQAWLLAYLLRHPCIDCGEADPIVLEFDHRDDCEKLFDLGTVTARGFCLRTVEAEVAKCDVRCANCHRRITYKRAGRRHRG